MKVLVTGGTGSLGRVLVRALARGGHTVRVMSQREREASDAGGVEWARADLVTGAGLREAVAGVGTIFHLASDFNNAQAVDVGGTRRLAGAARAGGVAHLVYVSIVGVEEIPTGYYKCKREAEAIVASSGVPYSILRATQFHSFVGGLLSKAARVPLVLPLPADFEFQSVDERDVAQRLARCVEEGPRGRLADFGGPEVLTLGEMAAAWLEARGVRRRVLQLPLPGKVAAAFRAGKNTAPDGERGVRSWREWLNATTRAAVGAAGSREALRS